ncbi:MAG: tetratricopeptide repeat protein, partial [Halothiobacillaceae bacterium]
MAGAAPAEVTHAQALSLHRNGHPAEAARLLEALHKQYPHERRYLCDLAAALAAAGQDREVLALREQVGQQAPPYVTDSGACSHRPSAASTSRR